MTIYDGLPKMVMKCVDEWSRRHGTSMKCLVVPSEWRARRQCYAVDHGRHDLPLRGPIQTPTGARCTVKCLTRSVYMTKPQKPPLKIENKEASQQAAAVRRTDQEGSRSANENLYGPELDRAERAAGRSDNAGGQTEIGKSFMALDLAIAVASGGKFLGEACQQGDVLALFLEDNDRRLQRRMTTMLGAQNGEVAQSRLRNRVATDWPMAAST